MAKKVKRKTVRKTTKKHFKAPWWKLFFVIAAATFIAVPVASKLNMAPFQYGVLGEKTASNTPIPVRNPVGPRRIHIGVFIKTYDRAGRVVNREQMSVSLYKLRGNDDKKRVLISQRRTDRNNFTQFSAQSGDNTYLLKLKIRDGWKMREGSSDSLKIFPIAAELEVDAIDHTFEIEQI